MSDCELESDRRGDYPVKVGELEVSPDPVKSGQPATFTVSASTGKRWYFVFSSRFNLLSLLFFILVCLLSPYLLAYNSYLVRTKGISNLFMAIIFYVF